LKAGKRLFGRPVLGGLDNRGVILDGSPAEIEAAVHDIIDTVGPKNLIIGADCTLPTEIDRENIRLAIQATGTYPMPKQGIN
jgi:uroporphyrinogen decarboxylase